MHYLVKRVPKAVLRQYWAILRLMLNGKINYINAEHIIGDFSNLSGAPNVSSKANPVIITVEDHRRYWYKYYPDHTDAIMEVLEDFIIGEVVLRKRNGDLLCKTREAIFWRPRVSAGVVYNKQMLERVEKQRGGHDFEQELKDQFQAQLVLNLVTEERERLNDVISVWIWSWFRGTQRGVSSKSRSMTGKMLHFSIYCTIGYVIADMPIYAKKLKPLLQLWNDGNFPVWVDKEGVVQFVVIP